MTQLALECIDRGSRCPALGYALHPRCLADTGGRACTSEGLGSGAWLGWRGRPDDEELTRHDLSGWDEGMPYERVMKLRCGPRRTR